MATTYTPNYDLGKQEDPKIYLIWIRLLTIWMQSIPR